MSKRLITHHPGPWVPRKGPVLCFSLRPRLAYRPDASDTGTLVPIVKPDPAGFCGATENHATRLTRHAIDQRIGFGFQCNWPIHGPSKLSDDEALARLDNDGSGIVDTEYYEEAFNAALRSGDIDLAKWIHSADKSVRHTEDTVRAIIADGRFLDMLWVTAYNYPVHLPVFPIDICIERGDARMARWIKSHFSVFHDKLVSPKRLDAFRRILVESRTIH